MQSQPETPVSAEAAYAAALNRALKTTEALVLAEAQVLEMRGVLNRRDERLDETQRMYELARDRATRYRRRLRRFEDQEEEGVKSSGEESSHGYAEAVSEAIPAGDFSD